MYRHANKGLRGWCKRCWRFSLLVGLASSAISPEVHAQDARIPLAHEIFAGSEAEGYLRLLQSLGRADLHPWGVRAFGSEELRRLTPADSAHPWAHRFSFTPDTAAGFRLQWVRPAMRGLYNSAFPAPADGAVWAGRGLTAAIRGGVAGRLGPLSFTVAPEAFWTENRDFEIFDNEAPGNLAFGARTLWDHIDLPQRFGDTPYWRIDPGQSTVRVDMGGVAAGLSTASQSWGPAAEHALILGSHAPGFAHLFVGTSKPVNLWLLTAHGRVLWGRLEQSEFSFVPHERRRRLMSGLVASVSPRGMPGLELGLSRFFHDFWPYEGFGSEQLLQPFEGFLKTRLGEDHHDINNQLASVYARWVLPAHGFELYGEFAREDHSWDLRHFLLEPDDVGGYMLGFRKVWERSDTRWVVIRGELLNTETSHLAITDVVRGQSPMYIHRMQRQGHTHRGQLLASAPAFAGGAAFLAADRYEESGRWTLRWERALHGSIGEYWRVGREEPRGRDVAHELSVQGVRFLGRLEVDGGISAIYNLNRNHDQDVLGMALRIGVRAAF